MGMLLVEQDAEEKDPVMARASQLALGELGGIDIVHNDFDRFLVQLQDTCPIMRVLCLKGVPLAMLLVTRRSPLARTRRSSLFWMR